MCKKLLLLLLALALCVCGVACKKEEPQEPTSPAGPTNPPEGEKPPTLVQGAVFEDSTVSWELYTDGTVYIKGTGAMPDFNADVTKNDSPQPWAMFRSGAGNVIRKVVVEHGVTELAEQAFAYCMYIESVSLPSTLVSIPYQCFLSCSFLTSVTGGSGLVEIEESAFENCTRLAEIELSDTLATVSAGAFHYTPGNANNILTVLFDGGQTAWDVKKQSLAIASGNEILQNATAIDPDEQ